jgi:hypothetical protein
MRQGGDGVERIKGIHVLGWLFGILQFAVFAAFIAMGANKQGRLAALKKPLLIGLLLNVLVFCVMMAAYWNYAGEGSSALLGSLPWPTALMMYGVWPIQLIFVFIYIWGFDRWIFTDTDMEKFRQLTATSKKKAGDSS